MVITNRLGITDSPTLAREEEQISKKRQQHCLKKTYLMICLVVRGLPLQKSILYYSKIYMILLVHYEVWILLKVIFALFLSCILLKQLEPLKICLNLLLKKLWKVCWNECCSSFIEGNGRSMRLWLDMYVVYRTTKESIGIGSQVKIEQYLSLWNEVQ